MRKTQEDLVESMMPALLSAREDIRRNGFERPFDAYRLAFDTLEHFDIPYAGPLVGQTVRVKEGWIRLGLIPSIIVEETETVLQVVANCHDRVIVYYPDAEIYVGWLDPDEYEVVEVQRFLTPNILQ